LVESNGDSVVDCWIVNNYYFEYLDIGERRGAVVGAEESLKKIKIRKFKGII
jgi:hypothetical protein